MTITRHELRQARTSWLIWTGSIAFLLAVCIFLFPEMKGQMDGVTEMFASMGSFTAAFGMDRLNFGTLTGYYAIECGNVLGLGGAFYAALCAVDVLAKEERIHTADLLFTHPVSRVRVMTEKLVSVLLRLTALSVIIYLVSVGSMLAIGEEVPWKVSPATPPKRTPQRARLAIRFPQEGAFLRGVPSALTRWARS